MRRLRVRTAGNSAATERRNLLRTPRQAAPLRDTESRG